MESKDESILPPSSVEKNDEIASLINEEENQECPSSPDDKDEKILSSSDEKDEEIPPSSDEKNDVENKKTDHNEKSGSNLSKGGETPLDIKGERPQLWLDDDNYDEKATMLEHKLSKMTRVVAKKNDKINELAALNQRLKKINHDFLQNITAQCDKHMKKMKEMTPSKAQGKVKNSPNENKRNCKFFNHPEKCKFGGKCLFIHKSQEESVNEESIIEEAASPTASEIKDEHNSESE